MPDHSAVGMSTQWGVESTAGGGGNAPIKLPNARVSLAPDGTFEEFRGEGQKYHATVQPGDEWSAGEVTGPLSFTEICYPLESAVRLATPTDLGGTPKAWQRIYESNNSSPDTVRTYTIEKGNGTANSKWNYAHCNGLSIVMARREATFSAPLMAQQEGIVQVLTGNPVTVENVLVVPKDIDLYYATTFAGLESSPIQIMRGFRFEFSLGDRFGAFFPMNSALDSFGGIVETEVDATANLRLGMDVKTYTAWAASTAYSVGAIRKRLTGSGQFVFRVKVAGTSGASEPTWPTTYLGTVVDGTVTWEAVYGDYVDPVNLGIMRLGSMIYLRCKATGPLISGTNYYLLQIDLAAQVREPLSKEAEDGLLMNTWPLRIIHDPTAGKPFSIKVINRLSDVATGST